MWPIKIQTPEAIRGILLMFSFIPAAGFLFLAVIFSFYGLTDKFLLTIREDLLKRRAGFSAHADVSQKQREDNRSN